jgi:hypothetical protein
VDPELEKLLLRCLAKEPGHRPNAADVARKLTLAGETPSTPPARAVAMPGFFGRLTERRLPQIVIAYAAVAWGVLGVADQLVERSVLPELVYRLALVALATGLPAVLTGAWFHGKKGRQRIEPVEYWVFGGLAVIWLAVSALIILRWRAG